MKYALLTLIALSIVLSGCFIFGEQEQVNVTENETPPPPPPPPKPSFDITSPGDGDVIEVEGETGSVTIVLSTKNLLLRPPGGLKTDGQGHFKISVDGGPGEASSSKIHEVPGLELGSHTVEVELVNNDGTPYVPSIKKQVSFTLKQMEPEVYVPQTYEVIIHDFEYDPAEITVKQTDSITFVNQGAFPRSATCFIGGMEMFNTGVLGNGQSATVTLNDIMECEYYSTTHRAMTGKVIVVSNE